MQKALLLTCFTLLLHLGAGAQYTVKFMVNDHSPIQREKVFISGSFNNWDSLSSPRAQLTHEHNGIHTIVLHLPGGRHEYKFTGGNWLSVEKHLTGGETGANRSCTITRDTTITADIFQWRDLMIPASKRQLQKATHDSTRVKSLTVLTTAYSGDPVLNNRDSAISYFHIGLNLISELDKGPLPNSWPAYSAWSTTLLSNYAGMLRSMGNYAGALEIRFRLLRYLEAKKDTIGMIAVLNEITYEYLSVKDYSNALTNAQNTLALLKTFRLVDPGDLYWQTITTSNFLARAYYFLHDIDKSLSYAQRMYRSAVNPHDYSNRGVIGQLIGDIYIARHQPDSAISYYKEAFPNAASVHNIQIQVMIYKGVALAYQQKNKLDSALYFARLSLNTIKHNKELFNASAEYAENYILDVTPILAALHRQRNNLDSAYYYLQLSVSLKDSINNTQRGRDLQNLAINESLRKQKEDQQIREERQRSATRLKMYGFLGGILVLSSLVFIQYRNSKQKQKTNVLLQEQKKDLETTLEHLNNTQAQLIHAEKMASLGELTAGIAHEIQNPLNFVNNFSDVNQELIGELREELAEGHLDQVKDLADTIRENEAKIVFHGKRADAIVKSMLMHSRTGSGQKELTDLNALVDEYVRLAYHGMRAKDKSFNVDFKTVLDPELPKINVVPQDIGRVLLNLINNAFQAVSSPPPPKGGFTTPDIVRIPSVLVQTRTLSPLQGVWGKTVEISVRDNGPGIPDSIRDKIFQPFFSTKPTGQGTGLGLSLSYDIVKAHGGELNVETKEGEGTTFIVRIPA